jgi:hypothetical protein
MRPRWYPTPRRVDIATPAVATGWSRINDSGGYWVIKSLAFQLATDANVANRFVTVAAAAAEDAWWRTTSQIAQPASLTRQYSGWDSSPSTTVDSGSVVLLAFPADGLWLPPGNTLSSAIIGVAAGDQLSAIFLSVIELPRTLPASLLPMIGTFVDEEVYANAG